MNIHEKLVEKALPHIEAYQDDLLVHDKTELDNYPGRRFLHFTGNTGTNIITLYWLEDYPKKDEWVPYLFGTADRQHILKGISETLKCMPNCNRMSLILHYDGKDLKIITYNQAKEIVSDYTYMMNNEFSEN